jgi:hypothetical protein
VIYLVSAYHGQYGDCGRNGIGPGRAAPPRPTHATSRLDSEDVHWNLRTPIGICIRCWNLSTGGTAISRQVRQEGRFCQQKGRQCQQEGRLCRSTTCVLHTPQLDPAIPLDRLSGSTAPSCPRGAEIGTFPGLSVRDAWTREAGHLRGKGEQRIGWQRGYTAYTD